MKRGRPKRNIIDQLRTKVWFAQAAVSAGYRSPYWFWKEVGNQRGDRANWERYMRGQRVPRIGKNGDPVALVEMRIPGSAKIFRSRVWDVLKGQKLSCDVVIAAINELGAPSSEIILSGGYGATNGRISAPKALEDVLGELELFPTFATLQSLILLLAWADDLGNVTFRNEVCRFYRQMIPTFILENGIPFHEKVFDAVDGVAQTLIFTKVNERLESQETWRSELSRYQEILAERDYAIMEYWTKTPKHMRG